MIQKTNATEAQRVAEINRALPFADPIAVGQTYDDDLEDALHEDSAREWGKRFERIRHRGTDLPESEWAGGYTGTDPGDVVGIVHDGGYLLPKSVAERLLGAGRGAAIIRSHKADGSHVDRPVTLGKVFPDRGSDWFTPLDPDTDWSGHTFSVDNPRP